MATTEQIIADIIRREGAYVDHASDKGGPTKYGITAGTLGEWRGLSRPATRSEVQALTETEAVAIYRQRYIEAPGFIAIADDALRAQLVDDAALSGPVAAIKALQRALGVPHDGILGTVTLDAVERADVAALRTKLVKDRCLRLARIVQASPDQRVFLVGWLSRALGFL